VRAVLACRGHEGGLGEVDLGGDPLHVGVVQPAGIEDDSRRVAAGGIRAEGGVAEDLGGGHLPRLGVPDAVRGRCRGCRGRQQPAESAEGLAEADRRLEQPLDLQTVGCRDQQGSEVFGGYVVADIAVRLLPAKRST
jgi:hypothetical protein